MLTYDALCQGFGMEGGVFCGVFDGHGRCGQLVSKLVRDYLPFLILSHRNALLPDDDEEPAFSDAASPSSSSTDDAPSPARQLLEEWRGACAGAFEAMDRELKAQAAAVDCSFSGTTAVCAIKQGRDLVVANVGDSRAVLARTSESGYLEAVQLTTDQKPSVPGNKRPLSPSSFPLPRQPPCVLVCSRTTGTNMTP
jgi:serine/threonine protein phosphatase PrpC